VKRAFLVYGPESSGNRLVTRLLVACGCYGDGTHTQRLNEGPPDTDLDIVWFRSVPYARVWPNLVDQIDQVKRYGYEPIILILSRDVYATAQSQIRVGHAKSLEAAYRSIQAAYKIIFDAITHHNVDYVMVSYESLFVRQSEYLGWLLDYLELELQQPIEQVTDQNGKYYKEIER
jgi:hypothetical protein